MKNHHKRDDEPLGARRIDKHERTTVRLPDWMSEQEYTACPEQIVILTKPRHIARLQLVTAA